MVWLDGTAQPVSAKNKAMVPNRVGNRKFIDVSPSGSGRTSTTLLNNADMRPGRQMRARPARLREQAASMGAAFVYAATVLISFHVWRNLSPAA
ncbi:MULTISPECIES: hypothetical protein [unclassified Burkholderia]|uniref:hypothetical protein n=1 Tax=unclassified Burkholderia TaxID=2613784 RepID=UPI001623EC4B|nr:MULTISPECIES: hypothetical protein [unclassified Burkholderia]